MKRIVKAFLVPALCAGMIGSSISAFAAFNPNEGHGNLIIEEAGTYVLTGSMHGSVYVNPDAGDVVLVMDNVTIDGGETSGIIAEGGDSVTIRTTEGSVNTVSGTGGDPDYAAAIYSNADITFEGDGRLVVNCIEENGIHTEDADIIFAGGEVGIYCADKAMGIFTGGRNAGEIFYNGGFVTVNDGAFIPNGGNTQSSATSLSNIITNQNKFDYSENNAAFAPAAAPSVAPAVSAESGNTLPAAPADPAAGTENAFPTAPQMPAQDAASSAEQPWQSAQSDAQIPAGQSEQTQPAAQPQSDQYQSAQPQFDQSQSTMPQFGQTQPTQPQSGQTQPGQPMGQQDMNIAGTLDSATEAGEIVEGITTNSAASLEADMENATYITVSDINSQVEISNSGTYVISGSSSDGNIVVKKGTTEVVLVLEDLDLTSTTGATLAANKNTEVQIIVAGNVTLTDAENPEDENSADADIADAFDGAAMKFKAGSSVYITGDGTLTLNGTAKNGIKTGDEASLVIDGDLTLNINAANDGINANYDLAILSGELVINSVDDGIHADHILTIGKEDGTGPVVTIVESTEGLEGTVVNIQGGDITINSSDDAINAANADSLYVGELTYSINMTGGSVTINSKGDGIDSNGNVNLIGGTANINSSVGAGEAGIDYDGQLYVSDIFKLFNNSGVSGADMMPGAMNGQMPFDMNGQMPSDMNGQMPSDMNGQMPSDMNGQMPGDINGQLPADMNGQVPADMNGQMPSDMNGQLPSDMGGQMPGDINGQVPR